MQFRYKQFTIQQDYAAMKVGTDADLLGTLSVGGRKILDIGTGTGVLSLMLAQRYPESEITAIEIDDQAIRDAEVNFRNSPMGQRITLHHQSFQDFYASKKAGGELGAFDSVVCNPPYFDKSLECDNLSKTRARHTSSLPFAVLIRGTYELLQDGGVFSVCIPGEVLSDFSAECLLQGFRLQDIYKIKTVPRKEPKRFVLVHKKGWVDNPQEHVYCMRNADGTRSDWYLNLMSDFHDVKG